MCMIGFYLALPIIGYCIGIPWMIFFLLSGWGLTLISFSRVLISISAVVVLGVLFHYELPVWYIFLFWAKVYRTWQHSTIWSQTRKGELTETQEYNAVNEADKISDLMCVGSYICMIYWFFSNQS